MRYFLLLLTFLSVFSFSGQSYAQDNEVEAPSNRYSFDKTHTQILFFVDHLGFSISQGEFLDFDGYFEFDKDHPEKSSVKVAIKTDSIDMDDLRWNGHMRSPDFFDVMKFPKMKFESTKIEVTGEKTANIIGDLTLLGIIKPVTLHVTHNKSDKHRFSGKYVSGFSANAKVKRSDFGMKFGLPGIGDEIDIRLEVEGYSEEVSEE